MKLFRKRKASDLYVWRLHGPDTKPDPDTVAARVVSIRAVDGYLATSPPKIGNRLLVHALVKFNTNQVRSTGSFFRLLIFFSTESSSLQQSRRTS